MGILPFAVGQLDSNITIQTSEDKALGKSTFRFDFNKNEFVTDVMGNVIKTTNAEEILEQVVEKILHDRRYKNLIYPNYYGNEIRFILEQDDPLEIVECELKRVYTEALIYHPLIQRVDNFSFHNEGDKIFCEFVIYGVDGSTVKKTEELDRKSVV